MKALPKVRHSGASDGLAATSPDLRGRTRAGSVRAKGASADIAPVGHASMHRPQPVQRSASTHALPSTNVRAACGQTSTQVPQPEQSATSTLTTETSPGAGGCS